MNPELGGDARAMSLVGFSAVATVTLLLCRRPRRAGLTPPRVPSAR